MRLTSSSEKVIGECDHWVLLVGPSETMQWILLEVVSALSLVFEVQGGTSGDGHDHLEGW